MLDDLVTSAQRQNLVIIPSVRELVVHQLLFPAINRSNTEKTCRLHALGVALTCLPLIQVRFGGGASGPPSLFLSSRRWLDVLVRLS
jgi:hypothetical protein